MIRNQNILSSQCNIMVGFILLFLLKIVFQLPQIFKRVFQFLQLFQISPAFCDLKNGFFRFSAHFLFTVFQQILLAFPGFPPLFQGFPPFCLSTIYLTPLCIVDGSTCANVSDWALVKNIQLKQNSSLLSHGSSYNVTHHGHCVLKCARLVFPQMHAIS